MLIYQENMSVPNAEYSAACLHGKEPVYYDIETTGLSHRASHIYLIGVLARNDGNWRLTQWFLDHPLKEKEMLEAFSDFLSSLPENAVLIDFNGSTFDLPYLRDKYAFYGMSSPIDSLPETDLFREVRKARKLLPVTSMKQKTLEDFLGTDRKDESSGGDLIEVYQNWLQDRDEDRLRQLLLHNRDDVLGLTKLLPLLAYPSLLAGNFHADLLEVSPREAQETEVSTPVAANFRVTPDLPLPVPVFCSAGAVRICPDPAGDATLLLSVNGRRGEMKHFFSDYKNYYYLPEEDTAVHRSVGVYVDPAYRENAKASTAYIRKNGVYFPQTTELFHPVFLEKHRGKPLYFEATALTSADPEQLRNYCVGLLQKLAREGRASEMLK